MLNPLLTNPLSAMAETLKIRKIGNSLGMLLPKELAAKMKVEEGDTLFVTEGPEGVTLTPFDPDFDEAMRDADEFLRTHRDAFRKLAGK